MASKLSMTDADHEKIGSTAPKLLRVNPGKNTAELMSDSELSDHMLREIGVVTAAHAELKNGVKSADKYFPIILKQLIADFSYLREIGRLDDCLQALDPEEYFK